MNYLKNVELARRYDVSEKAVRNWIESSREGKIKLELVKINNRLHIADSHPNNFMIEELVKRGRKYKNKSMRYEAHPEEAFYKFYNSAQVLDIISSLDKYRELPSQYRYVGDGALYWDAHLRRLHEASKNNMLTTTLELLKLERSYFDFLLENHSSVNVIDIGVGNGLAAKELLNYLLGTGKLKKYIGIDCSENLLGITKRNIDFWFSNKINTETYLRDISHQRFTDIINSDSYSRDASSTINIVLFLGGTIGNFKEPAQALQTIRESMNKNDVLITSDELDNESSRKFLGSGGTESFNHIYQRNKMLLDLLGVPENYYEIGKSFDEKTNSILLLAKIRSSLQINFKIKDYRKKITLDKDDSILLFRMWEWDSHQLDNLYEKNGFTQVRTTKLHNQEFVLLVSKVKSSSYDLT